MKNFETILNVGEDAAKYNEIDNSNELKMFFEQILPKPDQLLEKQAI